MKDDVQVRAYTRILGLSSKKSRQLKELVTRSERLDNMFTKKIKAKYPQLKAHEINAIVRHIPDEEYKVNTIDQGMNKVPVIARRLKIRLGD